jgi:hypothetical protein
MIRTEREKVQSGPPEQRNLYDDLFGTPHLAEQRRLAFARGYQLAYEKPKYASDMIAGVRAGRRDRLERVSAEVQR